MIGPLRFTEREFGGALGKEALGGDLTAPQTNIASFNTLSNARQVRMNVPQYVVIKSNVYLQFREAVSTLVSCSRRWPLPIYL